MTNRIDVRIIVREPHSTLMGLHLICSANLRRFPQCVSLHNLGTRRRTDRAIGRIASFANELHRPRAASATRRFRRRLARRFFPHDAPSNSTVSPPQPGGAADMGCPHYREVAGALILGNQSRRVIAKLDLEPTALTSRARAKSRPSRLHARPQSAESD